MTTARNDTRVALGGRHAHLWWIRPDTLTDPAELARCRALLTDDEREKTDRFRFARDRHTCLITRVLVRTTLSRYCDIPPARWRFRTNDHARPEIGTPPSTIRFNLSHTNGLIVCLVSRGREVGVDVESLNRANRWLDLAERFFAPREAAVLRRVDASERPTRFLEYWTLKEAYVKARYSRHYQISLEELNWLAERIELLGRKTHEICLKHITALRENADSSSSFPLPAVEVLDSSEKSGSSRIN